VLNKAGGLYKTGLIVANCRVVVEAGKRMAELEKKAKAKTEQKKNTESNKRSCDARRCGASLGGAQSNVFNPTLRLFSHTCLHISHTRLHTTSDNDQTRQHKKHKQQTNTITMVVEPLTPPAAWI